MHKCYFVANPYVRCGAGVDFALVNSACVRITNPRNCYAALAVIQYQKNKNVHDPFVLNKVIIEKSRIGRFLLNMN